MPETTTWDRLKAESAEALEGAAPSAPVVPEPTHDRDPRLHPGDDDLAKLMADPLPPRLVRDLSERAQAIRARLARAKVEMGEAEEDARDLPAIEAALRALGRRAA